MDLLRLTLDSNWSRRENDRALNIHCGILRWDPWFFALVRAAIDGQRSRSLDSRKRTDGRLSSMMIKRVSLRCFASVRIWAIDQTWFHCWIFSIDRSHGWEHRRDSVDLARRSDCIQPWPSSESKVTMERRRSFHGWVLRRNSSCLVFNLDRNRNLTRANRRILVVPSRLPRNEKNEIVIIKKLETNPNGNDESNRCKQNRTEQQQSYWGTRPANQKMRCCLRRR